MDATMTHVLSKLDAIREHQIREGEALSEIRHLLRSPQASILPPETSTSSAAYAGPIEADRLSKALRWVMSGKAALWLLQGFLRHLPTLGGILYMLATGQDEKIIAYINAQLFGF